MPHPATSQPECREDDNAHTPLLKSTSTPNATANALSGWADSVALSFQDWFSWDLLSATVATVSIVAIIVILAVFDGSSLPDWPSIFTINSIVSLFSSIAKLAFMSVVGSAISQSKWLWYRGGSKPLQDLELFDDASRGPWGALSLILKFKTRTLASLGAMVVVLSLLFDPFLQQVVGYRDRLVPIEMGASIVRAQRYLAPSYEGLSLPSVVDLSMKAAVYSGIFDAGNQASTGTEYTCSTGNCTFSHFSSLAVCSTCVDITNSIQKSCNATGCHELWLPEGPKISGYGGQINSSVTNISQKLKDLEASVVQFSTLISKHKNDFEDARAWECALYYCVNEYTATVTDGTFSQRVTRSWRNDSASYSQSGNLVYKPPASIINITANESVFYVDNKAARSLNSFMSDAFTGDGSTGNSKPNAAFSSDAIHALYEAGNLSVRVDNLAVSISNNMRQQNDSDSAPFSGTALKGQTYIKVRWAWFAYPGALLAMSLLSLAAIILETRYRKVNVWKSSTLAVLFHGQQLELSIRGTLPADTLSQMSQNSRNLSVELIQTEDRKWRLAQS